MPVRWSGKGQDEYGVYLKGEMEIGPFANLMERVERIGKEIIYLTEVSHPNNER